MNEIGLSRGGGAGLTRFFGRIILGLELGIFFFGMGWVPVFGFCFGLLGLADRWISYGHYGCYYGLSGCWA